tara:strand:- start:1808 stop:1990 length:183 start_codon:yes stop_codon:yes gene_type:complete
MISISVFRINCFLLMLLQGGTALDVLVDFFLDEVREDWIDILTALGRAGALYKRKVREGL